MARSTSTLKSARVSAGMAAAQRNASPLKAVPQLDLERFLGRWNEIARLPAPAQLLTDRRIALIFSRRDNQQLMLKRVCEQADGARRERVGIALRRYPIEEPGQFTCSHGPAWLRRLPSMWEDCWVLALDRDYGWMMLGKSTRRSLWILSRDTTMERNALEALKSRARAMGYDLAPLIVSGELRSYQPV